MRHECVWYVDLIFNRINLQWATLVKTKEENLYKLEAELHSLER